MKFDNIDRKFKLFDISMVNLHHLQHNMDQAQKQLVTLKHLTHLALESMPVLTHMQIVEGLENTVGNEYKIPIRKFERNKSREIDDYL